MQTHADRKVSSWEQGCETRILFLKRKFTSCR